MNHIIETIDGFEFTPCGFSKQPQNISPEAFQSLFKTVTRLTRASNWMLGDTLNLADRTWGNNHTGSKYEEASMRTGLSIGTLRNIVHACKTIPFEQRHEDLSFTHHLDVCGTADTVAEREELLEKAKEDGMSAKQFRKHLRKVKAVKSNKDAWENGSENLDRPFGIMDVSDADNAPDYPLALEFTRFVGWLSDVDVNKLPADQRKDVLKDISSVIRLSAPLFQLELKANPEASWDLPFEIKPLQGRKASLARA